MHVLSAFAAGLIFGLGLIVSGMADPSKVIGFLDLAGVWDPSLAFVIVGAIAVALVAYRFAQARTATLLGGAARWPAARHIDRRLVLGSLVFGVGWGLAGYCPGPALVSLGSGQDKAVVFTLAMIAGMAFFEIAERLRARAALETDG